MAVGSFQFDDETMWEVLKQLADREDVGITEAFIRLIIIARFSAAEAESVKLDVVSLVPGSFSVECDGPDHLVDEIQKIFKPR